MQVFLALTVIITYQSFFFVLFSNVDISSAISVTREGEAFFWAFCCHSSCRCCCPPLKGQRGVKILKEKLQRWRIPIFCIVGGCCYISILSHFPFSPFAPLQFPLLLHLSRGTFLPPSARVPFQSNSHFTFLLHHFFVNLSWHILTFSTAAIYFDQNFFSQTSGIREATCQS